MNTWPALANLAVPENVKAALIQHLTEPFQTEAEAKAFWLENSVHLLFSGGNRGQATIYMQGANSNYFFG